MKPTSPPGKSSTMSLARPTGGAGCRDDALRRLRQIEGQVRGLQRLIADDADCIDVLTQIGAVTAGLQKVALVLVDQRFRRCVEDSPGADPDVSEQHLVEVTRVVERLLHL